MSHTANSTAAHTLAELADNTAERRSSSSRRGRHLIERLPAYTSYGWPLVPIEPAGKAPCLELLRDIYGDTRIDHLKKAPALPAEVYYWFENDPDLNLAAIPSAAANLVIVDIDRLDLLNPSLSTPTASSGRVEGGKHLYFACPDQVARQKFEWGHLNPAYAVLPGSIHPSGRRYEWLPGLSPEETPLMAFDDALEALRLIGEPH